MIDKETLERLLIQERKSFRAASKETRLVISHLHHLARKYGLNTSRSRLAKKSYFCKSCGTQEPNKFAGRHRSICSKCTGRLYLKQREQVVTPVVSDTLIR